MGQINVNTAAKSDEADTLAIGNTVPFFDEGHNAARNQSGDLGKTNADTIAAFNKEMLAFVFLASFIKVGVQKFSGNIHNALDCAANGCPVDVHIKHAHKNRHAGHWLVAKSIRSAQFNRRLYFFN